MDRATERVLAYVNRIRRERLGLRPLKRLKKGEWHSNSACPIARSLLTKPRTELDIRFAVLSYCLVLGDEEINHPLYVKEWLERFDRGFYPDLLVT